MLGVLDEWGMECGTAWTWADFWDSANTHCSCRYPHPIQAAGLPPGCGDVSGFFLYDLSVTVVCEPQTSCPKYCTSFCGTRFGNSCFQGCSWSTWVWSCCWSVDWIMQGNWVSSVVKTLLFTEKGALEETLYHPEFLISSADNITTPKKLPHLRMVVK